MRIGNRRAQRPRIAVDGLEESSALRAHVADPEHGVSVQRAFEFSSENCSAIGDRKSGVEDRAR